MKVRENFVGEALQGRFGVGLIEAQVERDVIDADVLAGPQVVAQMSDV